jgi:hypothetical protein
VPKKDDVPAPLADERATTAAGFETEYPTEAACGDTSPVLVAGRDPGGRANAIDSLSEIMPKRTLFQEVGTFWEVLVRAPAIRMVVLTGELDGIPTESVLHMLGRRHPGLPVVSLDAPASAEDGGPHR